MRIRPKCKGLFFVHADGVQVTRYQFNAVLKMGLKMAEVDESSLRAHSFRIGAATTACLVGLSEDEIKGLGRWRSASVKSYIRVPTSSLSKGS
jgi:hypothetical protein